MKVGIVGGGVVGQATARSYLEHVDEVRVYDVLPERRTHSLGQVLESDLVFVCLPTPQREGSLECDVSAVEGFFADRGEYAYGSGVDSRSCNFVLRSTVPIGTTRRLREECGLPNLVHSPEFLTARCALVDAQMPARNIIGMPVVPETSWSWEFHSECRNLLAALYKQRWPHVPIHLMSSDESEFVKLAQNSAFAVKVALWNEFRTYADAVGLDWERVRNAILADGRIHPSHTTVPGHHGYGYSGTCLPKDIASLISCMRTVRTGLDVPEDLWVTMAAHLRNQYDRQREVGHGQDVR